MNSSMKCGKECPSGKKCSRKTGGGFCYQHSSSKSSKSPKSSISWINELPIPALQEVLLNMDRYTLNSTCRTNKRAANICRLPEFRRLYLKKHGEMQEMFFGKLRKTNFTENKSGIENTTTFRDDAKNELFIVYDVVRNGYEEDAVIRRIHYTRPGEKIMIMLELYPKTMKMFIGRWHTGTDISKPEEITRFLQNIGKSKWYPKITSSDGRQSTLQSAKEFYTLLQRQDSLHNILL